MNNAPGIVWKRRKTGWVAIWQPRTDLVKRGYPAGTVELWRGKGEPSDKDQEHIETQCIALQRKMLAFSRGDAMPAGGFDGTITGLIDRYKSDPASRYNKKLRHASKVHYDNLMKRLNKDYPAELIEMIDARTLIEWHETWVEESGVPMAHALIGMLRTLASYGMTLQKDKHCKELKFILHEMRFEMAKPRNERLTAEHAMAVIKTAHLWGLHSIALAQAFQFECMLRQKDVIGEWVPLKEPGASDVINQKTGEKWLRGIRWSEVDDKLILRHTTSKRNKDIEIDLKLAGMVVDEIKWMREHGYDRLPSSGPVIVAEYTGKPWKTYEFRRKWRLVARAAGVPDQVRNMDSRAGAITEASEAGAELEHIKQAATHGDISMTQRYSRNQRGKTDNVMTLRAAHRNKQ